MRKLCQFGFSDGAECLEVAVANIGNLWYCAEHYDNWIAYYRRHLLEDNGVHQSVLEDVKRILKRTDETKV